VVVQAAPQYVQAAPVSAAPAPVITDAAAFPALGAPAAPVSIQGWGPGSQGRVVVQQPVSTVAPIRTTVEFDGGALTHERSAAGGAEASGTQASATDERAKKNAAKIQAVASLQRLFFEEVARGGDANAAAAKALLRLAEAAACPSSL